MEQINTLFQQIKLSGQEKIDKLQKQIDKRRSELESTLAKYDKNTIAHYAPYQFDQLIKGSSRLSSDSLTFTNG